MRCREVEQQLASTSRPLDLELESEEARRDPEVLQQYGERQRLALQSYEAAAQQEAEQAEQQRRRRQGLPRRLVGVTASGALGLAAGMGLTKLVRALQRGLSQAGKQKSSADKRPKKGGAKAGAAKKRSSAGGAVKAAGGQQRRAGKSQQ
jgi:hypothetical protein